MPSIGLLELLKQVVSSWQVIAITIAILLYIAIVLNVSKKYRKPHVKKTKTPKKKKEAAAVPDGGDDSIPGDSNEELGLEEA